MLVIICFMEVYIEYAIIDNLVMDYLLLKGTGAICKVKLKKLNMFISSVIGCFVAIILPVFHINKALSFLIKILLALLVCLYANKHKNIFSYLKFVNVFILLTFIVGGTIIGVLSLMGIDYTVEGVKNAGVLPIGVNFAVAFIVYKFVNYSVKYWLNKNRNEVCCDVEIFANGKKVSAKGFFDSGNLLIDKSNNLPIAVCKKEIVESLFGESPNNRKMPFSTVSGISEIELFDIDYISVSFNGKKKKILDAVLGVPKLNPNFIGDTEIIVGVDAL